MAFPVVALGGATNLAAGAFRAPHDGGFTKGTRRVAVVSVRPQSRRLPVRAALPLDSQEPEETDEQRDARLTAEAVHLVEFRLKKVLPEGMLDSVQIPPKLTEIRSFVRWEDAGKPENTSREWQVREYQAALVDLKLEMLAGSNLNDVRRRYNLDTEFGDDVALHTPTSEQLSLLRIAADIVKEPEYYCPKKINVILTAEAVKEEKARAASQARIAVASMKMDTTSAGESKITESTETVAALELAFETQISDVGTADAAAAVEEEEDLHARIAAAADAMVTKTAEAVKRKADAESAALAVASFDALAAGEFGDDELAVLKHRLQQEADVAMDKARIKADAAKKVKTQMEALAMKAKAAKKAAKVDAVPVAVTEAKTDELTPAQKKQIEIAKAKAAAEAQLKAAREEMFAAKAALEATKTAKPVAAAKPAPVAAEKTVPTPAFPPPPVSAPVKPTPVVAKAPEAAKAPAVKAPAPVAPTTTPTVAPVANAAAAYGVKRSATEIEAKAAAKLLAQAQAAEDAKAEELELRRTEAAAEKRAAEAAVKAAKETKRAATVSAAAVASAVDDRVKSLEALHAKHVESLLVEHEQALVAGRAAAAAEFGESLENASSSSEKLLRGKLSEAVTALETSNAQVKLLKSKLAKGRDELEKVKVITAKAAEVLESRSADQRLISSLKRELDVAVELEAAAEARAAAAEKTASALTKKHDVPLGQKSKDELINQLQLELREANDVVVEFKTSWEADRKVIALLSEMKDVNEANAAHASVVASAQEDSNLKSAGLWGLAKKYGKKTLEISSELWFGEGKDANAADVALRASAAKRSNAKAVEEDVYSRVGGSATVARLRSKQGGQVSDTKQSLRQRSWLAAADVATEKATADEVVKPVIKAEVTETVKTPEPTPVKAAVPPVPATPKAREVMKKPIEKETPVVAESQKNNAVPLPAKVPSTTSDRVAAVAAKPKAAPKAWGATNGAVAQPSTPFTPSIKIPPAANDEEPKSSGWSSAHMPPGR